MEPSICIARPQGTNTLTDTTAKRHIRMVDTIPLPPYPCIHPAVIFRRSFVYGVFLAIRPAQGLGGNPQFIPFSIRKCLSAGLRNNIIRRAFKVTVTSGSFTWNWWWQVSCVDWLDFGNTLNIYPEQPAWDMEPNSTIVQAFWFFYITAFSIFMIFGFWHRKSAKVRLEYFQIRSNTLSKKERLTVVKHWISKISAWMPL